MNTTVIVVNETGVIEVANLSHEFLTHLTDMVDGLKKGKTRKPRKTRDWSDEQRAAFRARMIAGREAKALNETKVIEVKPVVVRKKDPLTKLADEIAKNSTRVLDSLDIKAPMPRTVHKVEAKPIVE